jgi:uncharacterized protein DUF1775
VLTLLALLQVSVSPPGITPSDLERLAVRVANPADTAIVAVRVQVPDALVVLGLDAPTGWTGRLVPGTDSAAPAIEWSGGSLAKGEFREFAFFVRLGAAARQNDLLLPVEIRRADGTVMRWRPGGDGPVPVVRILGSIGVTSGGSFALAAAAFGLAALGVALALFRRRP